MNTDENQNRSLMKYAGIGAVLLLVVGMLAFGIAYQYFPSTFHSFFTQQQAAHDTVDKTQNADWALNNYEWFKQQKQDIDAKKRQIQNTHEQIEMMGCTEDRDRSWQEQQECNQLFTELRGQKQMYEQLVADYEARRSQVHRNQWFDDLPYDIDDNMQKYAIR